jgi:3-hydroxybutyryl-CoA dehydratase
MIRAEVTVNGMHIAERRVKQECACSVLGKKVLVGEATVLAPPRKFD